MAKGGEDGSGLKKKWYEIGFQVDRLLIGSFLPPFVMSFFIALFVLIMQFLWKFIDDIIGKGVGMLVIMELFFYKSVSLFPLALPIAILLAAVMVMGNLAERYELSSFKSAGVPLTRVLRPLIGTSMLIGLFSFYCSNTIIPLANLKYQSRLYDIRNQKPTLSIEPGVFNEDFRGYSIRVGKKLNDKQTIEDIMVYDDSPRSRGKLSVVTAKKGKMYVSKEDGAFVMTLYDGYQYTEADDDEKPDALPFMVSHFKEWTRRFDLSEFDMDRTEEDQFKSHYSMKSARQIAIEIDTLNEQIEIARTSNQQPYALLKDSADA
ncbi:MAG TPA: LptF/LptG family permease, partial [Saprospiraceae bacterium]|nr:LptF/LptG family permease [Saprospiraceae bacterium]